MYQAGLILEGGGMKGIYTTGVLDFFLEKEVEFAECYGVSAGACAMCNYLSKQKDRGLKVNTDYVKDKNYCGIYSLVTTGDIFGADMCYNRIPNELSPYDYEEYERYKGKAYAVITDVVTGKAVYRRVVDMHKDIVAIQASSSMPLVSNMVEIDERKYLDGGIADCIPIMHSLKSGNRKNVIIMTKENGYRREPSSLMRAIRFKYRHYPAIIHNMEHRHERYNRTLDFVEKEEKRGNVFVIRPQYPSKVGRIEKKAERLYALYRQGYRDAEKNYEKMIAYLTT